MSGTKYPIIIAAVFMISLVIMVFFLHIPLLIIFIIYLVTLLVVMIIFRINLKTLLANYYFATGNYEKAQNSYLNLIPKGMKSSAAYLNLAILKVRQNNAEEALLYLEKAETFNPTVITDKNIMLTKGSCYWVLGDVDKAIEVLENLRRKYDYVNCNVLTTLGYMYILKDDLDKAYELTEKAIADDEKSASAWDNLGQIEFKRNDFDKAKDAFLKAIEFKSDLPDSNYFLGIIEKQAGNKLKAKDYLEKAKECKISALNTITLEQIEKELESLTE